ncbi:MAG: S8 family serine peptidase [Winogradskyella sp.]|nr:S8 family serine peptidase [Winogradskyella sp.]
MKKFILLILILVFAANNQIFSQEISQERFNLLSEANKKLYTQLYNEYLERQSRIEDFLLLNENAKKRFIENGTIYEIRDIINGYPIYLTTDNALAAAATKTDQLHTGGSLGLNLDGSGMVVGVWDGGPVQSSHPEFSINILNSRVLVIDSETPDGDIGFSNHGTHVAGTIGAQGVDPLAKGMAPNVEIKSYGWINDLSEMLLATTDVNQPIYLSNHSYGVPVSSYVSSGQEALIGAYIQDSRNIDDLIYNNPKYLPVASAGNSGTVSHSGQLSSGLDKLTQEKTSKNNLVVANANPSVFNGNLTNLVINPGSSQGPTDDFRIKPDIAGDGTNLYSPTANSTYSIFSGTSMSAPNVTGTLVLLQQYYSQLNGGEFMNASTLKALVCHTSVDDNAQPGPDPVFGWGFLDAKQSAEVISAADTNEAVLQELTLENNDTYSFTFTAEAGAKLSATICWTDLPGNVASGVLNDPTPVLVNDLDLRITKDATTYLPWRLSPSLIGGVTNSKGDNVVDNIERVDIDVPTTGIYTLLVTHKGSLQGNGPNPFAQSQDFSLIITGNNLTLSVDENDLARKLAVYPNPSNGEFTITFESNLNSVDNSVKIDVYDIQGRLVYNNSFINSSSLFKETIKLENAKAGVYMVNISEGNRTTSHKLVIQ